METDKSKQVLNEKETAEYSGFSRSFLRQCRMNGPRANGTEGPAFIKIGRAVRYFKADVELWLKTHRIGEEGDCK